MRKRSWISKIVLALKPENFCLWTIFRLKNFGNLKEIFGTSTFVNQLLLTKIFYFKTFTRWKFPTLLRIAFQRRGIYTTRSRWTKNACFKIFTSWKLLTILKANFEGCGQFTINFRWTKNICFKTLTSWKISKFGKAIFASSFRVTRRSSQQVCLWNCGCTLSFQL